MSFAVRVENLGKRYLISRQAERGKYRTLREAIGTAVAAPYRRLRYGASDPPEDFWALKDVSFDIQPGEVVGIIGRNGAGKSTLLKILSRITKPTTGRVSIRGRVASLLEVGTGFHQELTGRENIFLNGAILGMTRRDIRAKFDEIVAFAEVEKFLDTPVKRYSSGMYVRLAFAIAAHLEPEILIVDEVLAVGDMDFQKKCLGRLSSVARNGRTVLFVSHNMQAVTSLCQRCVVMDCGSIIADGDTTNTISKYLHIGASLVTRHKSFQSMPSAISLLDVTCDQPSSRHGAFDTKHEITVSMRICAKGILLDQMICGFTLLTDSGYPFLSTYFNDLGDTRSKGTLDGTFLFTCRIPSHYLNEGRFRLLFDVGIAKQRKFTTEDVHFIDIDLDNTNGVGSRFLLGRHWRNTPMLPLMNWSCDSRN